MKLHDLKSNIGATKRRKRVGRGIAAGQGKTCGRGMKGQGARTGGGAGLYHTGGNLPLFRKLPFLRGVGFRLVNRVEYNEINIDQLSEFNADSEITPETLEKARLLHQPRNPVVILGRGEIEKPLKVKVHRISKPAKVKIEEAGGSVELIKD